MQARIVSLTIITTIVVSTSAFIIETLPQFHFTHQDVFSVIEDVSVGIFTLEYMLRSVHTQARVVVRRLRR